MNEEAIDIEILNDFIAEVSEQLSSSEPILVELEHNPNDRSGIDTLFRTLHSIKGSSGFFNLKAIRLVTHSLENVLDAIRAGRLGISPDVVSLLLKGTDLTKLAISTIDPQNPARELTPEEEAILKETEALLSQATATRQPITTAATSPSGTTPHIEATGPKSLRISEAKLDEFMKHAGELIMVSEALSHLYRTLSQESLHSAVSVELKNVLIQFNSLSRSLQDSLMEVRKVSVNTLLGKTARIVRDTCIQTGKAAQLSISGEDLLVDKSILEILEDPLVHLVRNSIDHGLESPEERQALGKSPEGQVQIEATVSASHFTLTIRDDGQGMDAERIRKAAVQKGILSEVEANALPDSEALRLVFQPGFSTAQNVSEISGRGVGLDVALSNVTRMNGSVDIKTELGKGTEFSVRIPVAVGVSVISGLVVVVKNTHFIIPIERIQEVAHLQANEKHELDPENPFIQLRDQTLPILDLRAFLDGGSFSNLQEHQPAVVVRAQNHAACILVEQLHGIQRVVVKSLQESFEDLSSLSGAAIMGDGSVGLVLNIPTLIQTRKDRCA